MKEKLKKGWMILLAPVTLVLAGLVFLQIALVNFSFQPAIRFWEEYVF